MLTQVEVLTQGVSAPPFSFGEGDVATDPIQIRNIEGLGPVATSVNTVQYGSVDGEFYNGSTTGKRNIVLTLGFRPDWVNHTYEDLRRIAYGYFMPKTPIKMIFTSTHMPQVKISGIVETCEPNPFSSDPEMQVSIICPKPYFESVASNAISGTTADLTDLVPTVINYEGDVEVGYVLDVAYQDGGAAVSNAEIRIINNTPTSQILSVKTALVDSTHLLRVSTVSGDKYAKQIPLPSGTEQKILGKVAPGSIWAPLVRGVNNFQVLSANPGQSWTLSYFARYGGL